MIYKGRLNYAVFIIIVAIISLFLGYTNCGKFVVNSFIGTFIPEETYTVYIDDVTIVNQNYSQKIERNEYKFQIYIDGTNPDLLITLGNPAENYKKSSVINSTTVLSVIHKDQYKVGLESGNVIDIRNGDYLKYRQGDLGLILKGIIEDKTWKDIGFYSNEEISLLLPKNEKLLEIVKIAVLSILSNEENPEELLEILLDKASYYTSSNIEDIDKNQFVLFVEFDGTFDYLWNNKKLYPVYPNNPILYPVYLNWNDSKFDTLNEFFQKYPKKAFLNLTKMRQYDGIYSYNRFPNGFKWTKLF